MKSIIIDILAVLHIIRVVVVGLWCEEASCI